MTRLQCLLVAGFFGALLFCTNGLICLFGRIPSNHTRFGYDAKIQKNLLVSTLANVTRECNASTSDTPHDGSVSSSTEPCTKIGGCRENITAIVYNRIPKCGSRTVLSAMKIVAKTNSFNVYSLEPVSAQREFPRETWDEVWRNYSSIYEQPFLYSQHLHFFDFNRTPASPITAYVNVVRDPIERLISHYYFRQHGDLNGVKPTSNNTLSLEECLAKYGPVTRCLTTDGGPIVFLCGHNSECKHSGADAVQHAKRNIDKYYTVVGLTEDLPAFMYVLEYLLPDFFTGISKDYDKRGTEQHDKYRTAKKEPLKDETRELLKKYLSWDYELYGYITARFYSQFNRIRLQQEGDNYVR